MLLRCCQSQFAEHCLWTNLSIKLTHSLTQIVSPEPYFGVESCTDAFTMLPKSICRALSLVWSFCEIHSLTNSECESWITIQIPKFWLINIKIIHYSVTNCQNWANGIHFDPKPDFEWNKTLSFSESIQFAKRSYNRDTPSCCVLLILVLWKSCVIPIIEIMY